MVKWLLDTLVPWWLKVAAIVAILMSLWGAWIGFKHWVSKPMVEAALIKERAKTEPAFKELTASFNTLKGTFNNITAASNLERAKRKAEIEAKKKELNHALTQNKSLKDDLAKLHGLGAELDSMLNAVAANNNSAIGASASTRLKQLSAAHQQCERALRESDGDLAEALGRLDEALAVVRALSPSK